MDNKMVLNTAAIMDGLLRHYSRAGFLALRDRIGGSARRFALVVALLDSSDRRLALRASWLLTMCAEARPNLLLPHLPALLTRAAHPDAEEGLRRNIVRSLQFVRIPPRLQGRAVELCFRFLQEKRTPIALKVFSMSVLADIADAQPELKQEIALVIEQMIPYGSAGIRSRGRNVLVRLRK